MGVISFKHKGNLKDTKNFLEKASKLNVERILARHGEKGVRSLKSATPVDTGNTAGSWYYEIRKNKASYSLQFKNTNTNQGIPIPILIQYGHATRTGGYVEGIDFINPALQPIFDEIVKDLWEEVRGI